MPNNAVHVPGDVWAGVTREDAALTAAGLMLDAMDDSKFGFTELPDSFRRVAAALRRLAPYLPSEAPQEAVQPPCDVEPGA